MSRLLALLILVIPGAISALGIKLMRDTLFGHTIKPFSALWLPRVVRIHLFCDRPLCAGRVHFIQRQKTQSSQPAIQKTIAEKKPENAPAFFVALFVRQNGLGNRFV